MLGYWALMDESDYVGGHGSHVCGSVAGAALAATAAATAAGGGGDGASVTAAAGLDRFNGMAPGARLIFADLQCNAPDGPDGEPGECSCGGQEHGVSEQGGFGSGAECPCSDYPSGRCPASGFLYPPHDLGSAYVGTLGHEKTKKKKKQKKEHPRCALCVCVFGFSRYS